MNEQSDSDNPGSRMTPEFCANAPWPEFSAVAGEAKETLRMVSDRMLDSEQITEAICRELFTLRSHMRSASDNRNELVLTPAEAGIAGYALEMWAQRVLEAFERRGNAHNN